MPLHNVNNFGSKIEHAKSTGLLHLNQSRLYTIPACVFEISNLYRLDLGFNELKALPDAIASLVNLEYLWVNHNPLIQLSEKIAQCKKLKQLDVSFTQLRKLPYELGRLEHLHSIHLEQCPLKPKFMQTKNGLTDFLQEQDERKKLKTRLFERLTENPYDKVMAEPEGEQKIRYVVKQIFKVFKNGEDIKNVVRNSERLFPKDIDAVEANKIYHQYITLKRENDKKKLCVDLELKIKVIYFDRIEPPLVEKIVRSINAEIHDLEDMKFLIKHAPALLPEDPKLIDATKVHDALILLQEQLARERAAAITSVFKAVSSIYSDVEPDKVQAIVDQVSVLFKNSNDLKSLAADAHIHFPKEFLSVKAKEVRQNFLQSKSEMLSTTVTSGDNTLKKP